MSLHAFWQLLWREPRSPFQPNTLLIIGIVVTLTVLALTSHRLWNFSEDDLFISLRYARNLVEGRGLVWNPGEPVEGYTNFLLVMYAALAGWLGFDMIIACKLLSTACYILIIAFLAYAMPRITKMPDAFSPSEKWLYLFIPISVAVLYPPMMLWARGGLEPHLFGLLFLVGTYLTIRASQQQNSSVSYSFFIGVIFALATLTRPEGALFYGLCMPFLVLIWLREISFLGAMKKLLPGTLSYLAILVPYLAWKWAYYGDLLPNTWYVKNTGIHRSYLIRHGFHDFSEYFLTPPFPFIFILVLSVFCYRKRIVQRHTSFLLSVITIYVCYVIWIGGDYMLSGRFIAPIIPLVALAFYENLLTLRAHSSQQLGHNFVIAFLTSSFLLIGVLNAKDYSTSVLSGYVVAPYVEKHWPKKSVIAVSPAGTLPYLLPEYTYIDTFGINDKHIARAPALEPENEDQRDIFQPGHMKGDGEYVLSRKPDYIIFNNFWGEFLSTTAGMAYYPSEQQVIRHPDFKRYYRKKEVILDINSELAPTLHYGFVQHLKNLFTSYHGSNVLFIFYERIDDADVVDDPSES